jgi:hypothetical protein
MKLVERANAGLHAHVIENAAEPKDGGPFEGQRATHSRERESAHRPKLLRMTERSISTLQ